MKKLRFIFILALLGESSNISAQSFQNSDFEHWTTAADGTDSAEGWSSGNSVVVYPVISLYKSDDAYSGNHSAHVVTASFGIVQESTIGILVNGEAQFDYGGDEGNVTHVSGGGTPISYKPAALRGRYKYEAVQPDRGLCHVLLTRYNQSLQKRDTISHEVAPLTLQPQYTLFEIPLTDRMPGIMPDTITCVFYSSDPAGFEPSSAWSDLYIDSLQLVPPTGTGIGDVRKGQAFSIMPNPSNGIFHLISQVAAIDQAAVYNAEGKLTERLVLKRGQASKLDLSERPAGVYFLVPNDRSYPAQKLIVQH